MKKDKEENSKNNGSKKYGVIKLLIAIMLTAMITYFFTISVTLKSYLNRADMTYLATKLALVKNKLENVYIYDINEEKMIENAIKGYVTGIDDKYTQYLTAEEMKSLIEDTSGNYVGIGVYLVNNPSNNTILVVGVIENSAAEQAGIKAGDVIKKVDGIEYQGDQLDEATKVLKGEEGTNAQITILRNSEEKEFTIIRKNIKIQSVDSKMIDNNIGYIKILSFNEGTAEDFKTEYEKLKNENLSGLVIDLRNNGGGIVKESLEIAETMVEKDKILLITANKNKKEEITKSKELPIINVPVTVLINNNTASASEILAGILRDDCNYKIIGTTSYGKGVIQTIYTFSDGSGLKITSEEYFTPNHNTINKVGISPDIEIELDNEWKNVSNVPYEYDIQLQAAVKELK